MQWRVWLIWGWLIIGNHPNEVGQQISINFHRRIKIHVTVDALTKRSNRVINEITMLNDRLSRLYFIAIVVYEKWTIQGCDAVVVSWMSFAQSLSSARWIDLFFSLRTISYCHIFNVRGHLPVIKCGRSRSTVYSSYSQLRFVHMSSYSTDVVIYRLSVRLVLL